MSIKTVHFCGADSSEVVTHEVFYCKNKHIGLLDLRGISNHILSTFVNVKSKYSTHLLHNQFFSLMGQYTYSMLIHTITRSETLLVLT